jgi:hypothetical protein
MSPALDTIFEGLARMKSMTPAVDVVFRIWDSSSKTEIEKKKRCTCRLDKSESKLRNCEHPRTAQFCRRRGQEGVEFAERLPE